MLTHKIRILQAEEGSNMTEAEMLICAHCGKPVRMNPFNGYTLCPFCIAKNSHTAKDDVWCADKPISS